MCKALTVGVKYCGGCNCWYERESIVKQLRQEYPTLRISAAGGVGVYDVVLVVLVLRGCPRPCVDGRGLIGRRGKVTVACEADYDRLHSVIEQALRECEEVCI